MHDEGFCFFDKAHQIAPAYMGNHYAVAAAHFPIDLHRTCGAFQLSDADQGDRVAVLGGDAHGPEIGRRRANAFGPSQHDRRAAVALDDDSGTLPLDLCPQRVLDLIDIQTEPPGLKAVHCHAQVLHTIVLNRVHVLVAPHCLEQRFDLARVLVELFEVGSKNLYSEVAAHADDHLRYPHFDRLREAVLDAGHRIEHFAQFIHQRFLALHAPLSYRLQQQIRIGLIETHRIEPNFVGAGARDHPVYFGDSLHDGLVDLEIECGTLLQADRG